LEIENLRHTQGENVENDAKLGDMPSVFDLTLPPPTAFLP
jgi:hypothetical protein